LRSLDTLLPYFFLVSWNRLISLPNLALPLCSSVSSRRSCRRRRRRKKSQHNGLSVMGREWVTANLAFLRKLGFLVWGQAQAA
jgi:hypothetical protein